MGKILMFLLIGVLSPSTSNAEHLRTDLISTETKHVAFEGGYGRDSSIRREYPRSIVQY